MLALLAAGLLLAPGPTDAKLAWGFHDYLWAPQASDPTSPLTTDQVVQASRAAGATTDRLIVQWRDVEPYRGSYDWTSVDEPYVAMVSRGINPIVTVYAAPDWAADHSGGKCTDCSYRPDAAHEADFQAFLESLMLRLQSLGPDATQALEVWNEPNTKRFFYPKPDARKLVDLLQRAQWAATRVNTYFPDPGWSAPLISGGLAPYGSASSTHVATDRFLRAMYGHDFEGRVDGIGIHPYPAGTGDFTADMTGNPHYGLDTLTSIRDAHGDPNRFWVTELGVSSGDPHGGGGCKGILGCAWSEAAQGSALVDMYHALEVRQVDAVIFYGFEATDPAPGEQGGKFAGYGAVDTSSGSVVAKRSFCILGERLGNGNPGYGC